MGFVLWPPTFQVFMKYGTVFCLVVCFFFAVFLYKLRTFIYVTRWIFSEKFNDSSVVSIAIYIFSLSYPFIDFHLRMVIKNHIIVQWPNLTLSIFQIFFFSFMIGIVSYAIDKWPRNRECANNLMWCLDNPLNSHVSCDAFSFKCYQLFIPYTGFTSVVECRITDSLSTSKWLQIIQLIQYQVIFSTVSFRIKQFLSLEWIKLFVLPI